MTHTKCPLFYSRKYAEIYVKGQEGLIAENITPAIGKRIVACVNALAGIENPAEWVERAKKALGEIDSNHHETIMFMIYPPVILPRGYFISDYSPGSIMEWRVLGDTRNRLEKLVEAEKRIAGEK